MFELPECQILARQVNEILKGKVIHEGRLGNSPHKFVWYNRSPEEFSKLTRSKVVGEAYAKGRWIFIPMEPGYVLLLGEFGGKMNYHPAGSKIPKKYHLYITFTDDSFLTVTTQMWGAIELYAEGEEQKRQYVQGMRITPIESAFNLEYFCELIHELAAEQSRSVKSLLTQDQLIPGLGNSITQDILFHALLHPRHPLDELSEDQIKALYDAIIFITHQVINQGGRYDEFDLFGHAGGYVRIMDKNTAGNPCSRCGSKIEKMQYLGGTCYFCPSCQT